ncbi:Succinate--hydroxymethylglutarate CoA-transferase [Colletotrichum orbiculare MAFF 240422]|uniref:Succinate--hydroxymethylglutarate CoA-transferase n=1 Tax=Colletotrichum orbiculare (strain 104-T / ATCC 96160 / CBS 514.97 / LARS 414 / MAFF 240422) TaxID=1213857 RepID=A0A484FS12_COLOR|nr:Succinate--hydroxymethylglutarate CoA-transferase [Colletotrichum orbiculare MAFF 240422]
MSSTFFFDPGRNIIFVWTGLILSGLLSLAVEFYRSNAVPCLDGSGTSISSIGSFPYGDNDLCGIVCSQDAGPFSKLRTKAASEIFVVPKPTKFPFGMAMFLAAAECVPAILILVSMWKKILEINWKTRRESSTAEEAKLNDSETIPGTNGATPRGMEAVNQAIKSLLSAVEIPVFAGAWLAVLIIGEINFFSDQLAYHTEPIGSIGQWGTILGTGMAGLGSFYVWAADSKQELAQNQKNGRICSHCHGSRERRYKMIGKLVSGVPFRIASRPVRFLAQSSRLPTTWRQYSSMPSNKLPLDGYRVLDMTRVLAGPYCTQILGDLGAEVIKIEHPTRGDDTRAWGPPYATYRVDSKQDGPGESAYFLAVNRNKKSLGLNFQHPDGTKILHELVSKCDILVENYLPGTLKKYKLDYDTLRAINPGLIYASITGYGQTGPYSQRAGYDVMVEAEFGLMHITGSRDGPPVKVGVAVTDLTTGLYTSNSIMAALLARGKTGKGQHIDVALSDCQTATLANIASSCLISGKKDSGRWGTAHPSIVPYRSFKTLEGDILFGGGNDRLYGILCDGLNKPEWKDDPKYKTNAQRVANRVELEALIEEITVTKTTEEWLQVFEGKGMPYAAVNDVQGALEHEHTKARNMVVEMEHDECGPIRMVNTPVKYSESEPTIRTAPPTLGQHTHEVLGEHLGFTEERIRDLKSGGVIG